MITYLVPPHASLGQDRTAWIWDERYVFSIFSNYKTLSELVLGGALGEEDLYHMLRGCVRAKVVWAQLVQQDLLSDFFSGSFVVWFEENLREVGYAPLLRRNW
ncbi:hypothetical protein V6N11_018769 [Hibiscus sabdariffa]|uniref:Uncharacterized protein n=2 Tax=Hibiscus sabdariffa TaxID=183260 RepID=A0ABR2QT72_9ROSI